MYARELNGKEIVFYVTGKLWKASMVMGDQATGSEWSHILGECMQGKLKGQKLAAVASVITAPRERPGRNAFAPTAGSPSAPVTRSRRGRARCSSMRTDSSPPSPCQRTW